MGRYVHSNAHGRLEVRLAMAVETTQGLRDRVLNLTFVFRFRVWSLEADASLNRVKD